ncbi:hypothetical protein AB0M12_42370 [Nocardia vinacea]|uniref:hypothetical protein n=1 Tax=Nocardia vinacea TaxID=96468 RepID=UPI0034305F2B
MSTKIVEILQPAGTEPGLWVTLLVLVVPGIAYLIAGRMRDCQRHFVTRMVLRNSKPDTGMVMADGVAD